MTAGEVVLSNVGPGPDSLSLATLDAEFVVLVLHRDFYCSEDRQQVRHLKRRYEEFETRDVEVVSVLPEDAETTEQWQKQYHLPFPVVADPDADLGDRFEQGTRFGLLGRLHDVVGRMPAAVVLDVRGDAPREVFGHRGNSRTDRPHIDDLLEAVDKAAAIDAGTEPKSTETASEPTETTPETAESADFQDDRAEPTVYDRAEPTADDAAVADHSTDEGGVAAPPTDTTVEGQPNGDAVAADTLADESTTEAPPVTPDSQLDVPPGVDLPAAVSVRRAGADDVVPVLRVLHGALLDIESDRVREAVAAGEVLVVEDDGFVVGALVRDDSHVEAVAIRRERRKQGLGSALVEVAGADADGELSADFRAGLRGFWESLGFVVESRGDRLWGRRPEE